jgi:hypothetical protein
MLTWINWPCRKTLCSEMKNTSVKKRRRRLLALGVSDFETAADARKVQADLLERLERADFDPGYYVGLSDCRPDRCGRKRCTDACAFGARRRRLREILAVHRLLEETGSPVYDVWFTRPVWERPSGGLRSINISTVKKLNRRVLDKLYNADVVAVGAIKASSQFHEPTWTVQVHEVIAGAAKSDLDRVFAGIAYVKELKPDEVGQAIARVLRRDLDVWEGLSPPRAKRRAEFYKWTLSLPVDARVVRYGCDRRFNKLHKKPRPQRPKIRKSRPYPYWLEGHMFGRGRWTDVDPHSMTFEPKPKNVRIIDPDREYYTDVGGDDN